MNMVEALEHIAPVLTAEINENVKTMSNERINQLINLYLQMLEEESDGIDKMVIEFKAREYAVRLLRRQNVHEA